MENEQAVVVIIDKHKRNPYEVWLLSAVFLSATLYLLGLAEPRSVTSTLPTEYRFFWNLQLSIGSAVSLIGIFWNNPTMSRTIQITGQLWTGAGALVYASVMFYHNGVESAMAAIVVGSIAGAALSKAVQLRRQVKRMIQKVEERNGAYNDLHPHGGD